MKTIVETLNEPYMIEDRTTPVFEQTQFKKTGRLWLSFHEASSVTGEIIADIMDSADTQKPTKKGNQFGYPTRPVLRKYLPDYRFVANVPRPPVPVAAVYEIVRGRRKHTETKYFRTLTAFRQCSELTTRDTEIIFSRSAGWKKLLPPHMTSATPQTPGFVPPGGWPTTASKRSTDILFELGLKAGARPITIKYIGPSDAANIGELHYAVLRYSR